MRKSLLLLLVLPAVPLLSCIERPDAPQAHSNTFAAADRTFAREALMKEAPTPRHPVGAMFDGIELIGYDMTPDPAPHGGLTRMTVYYRALEDLSDDWQIFVHMEDQAKVEQRFNMDHYPAGGRLRTTAWKKGDIIRDDWTFTFPASMKSIEMWTGWYVEDTRMPLNAPGRGLSDGTGRVRAGILNSQ